MDKIKCPACGTEVLVGTENCPTCGAPVGAIGEDNISGVPIDNHAAIDTMLQGANRLVEQSAALGIGLDGDEAEGGESGEAIQRADINIPLPELSENQKNAMSGGVINLTPGNIPLNQGVPNKNSNTPSPAAAGLPASDLGVPGSSVPLSTGAESADASSGITLYEMDDNGNVIDPNKKSEKKAKREAEKKPKSSKGVIFLAVVISLAIGLAGGFFGKMFLFPELPTPDCQSFAEKAVNSVVKVIPQGKKLHIAEAYVKDFTSSQQCIFRAFSGEDSNAKSEWYRVKLDSDQTIRVYIQLDMEEYERLINSGDSEEQVRASVLMSIQNETDRCIEEAKNGEWAAANAILLNNTVNPYTPSERTPDKSLDNTNN